MPAPAFQEQAIACFIIAQFLEGDHFGDERGSCRFRDNRGTGLPPRSPLGSGIGFCWVSFLNPAYVREATDNNYLIQREKHHEFDCEQ
jgi:hypothetical protein